MPDGEVDPEMPDLVSVYGSSDESEAEEVDGEVDPEMPDLVSVYGSADESEVEE